LILGNLEDLTDRILVGRLGQLVTAALACHTGDKTCLLQIGHYRLEILH